MELTVGNIVLILLCAAAIGNTMFYYLQRGNAFKYSRYEHVDLWQFITIIINAFFILLIISGLFYVVFAYWNTPISQLIN